MNNWLAGLMASVVVCAAAAILLALPRALLWLVNRRWFVPFAFVCFALLGAWLGIETWGRK